MVNEDTPAASDSSLDTPPAVADTPVHRALLVGDLVFIGDQKFRIRKKTSGSDLVLRSLDRMTPRRTDWRVERHLLRLEGAYSGSKKQRRRLNQQLREDARLRVAAQAIVPAQEEQR